MWSTRGTTAVQGLLLVGQVGLVHAHPVGDVGGQPQRGKGLEVPQRLGRAEGRPAPVGLVHHVDAVLLGQLQGPLEDAAAVVEGEPVSPGLGVDEHRPGRCAPGDELLERGDVLVRASLHVVPICAIRRRSCFRWSAAISSGVSSSSGK